MPYQCRAERERAQWRKLHEAVAQIFAPKRGHSDQAHQPPDKPPGQDPYWGPTNLVGQSNNCLMEQTAAGSNIRSQ